MKFKLLAVSTVPAINIGDYIQALASSQFYPHIDGFVEREKLKEYDGDECKIIMNAYYMHDGSQWPPSNKIQPLFISTHINSLIRKEFGTKESIEFLKQKSPIGCRDYDTLHFLQSNGVDSYFSGCMTLTLGEKYKNSNKRKGVIFVDPKVTFRNKIEKAFYCALSFLFNNIVVSIGLKYYKKSSLTPNERSIMCKFYIKYSKLFTKDTLLSADYENQESKYYNMNFKTNDDLLREAERLVIKYSHAALVVTSRIHCALPCLGLETPVLYINNGEQAESSSCRLKGLRELFNVLEWKHSGISATFEHDGKLSVQNHPQNLETWRPLALELIKKSRSFINEEL